MAERISPWRPKPSQEVVDLLQQVGTLQLFLVQRPGPTSFIVREEGSEVKRKVQIGSRIICSCSPVGANGTSKELCLHILFVMVKVLRVPVSNPLLWQLSLSDRELEEVLRCAMQPERPPREVVKVKPSTEKMSTGQVKRREIDEEDPCPICYEDMIGQDLDNLVWCRFGCGRNVHGKCMGVWMEHQVQSLGKELTCPLCRSEWGEFKWRPPPPKRKVREERKDVHYGTHCGACKKAPLVGKRFRCLICADLDLCEGCFTGGHHPQHPFAVKATPKSFGAPAERPAMMPTALPITRLTVQPTSGAAAGQTSPRQVPNAMHLGQRTHSHSYLLDAASSSSPPRAAMAGCEGEAHVEAEAPAERRVSASGITGSGGGVGGGISGSERDALAIGVVGQHTIPPRQAGGGGGAPGARHPVRGTTIARAGAAGRAAAEEPPVLEARLAGQRRPLLAVEGLTVGPGGAAAAAGQGQPQDLADMLIRRAALGQPSRPVLVRRARSTVTHDRPAVEGPGGAGPSTELNLGLAGVPLNTGWDRSVQGEAAGAGPSSAVAATYRPQAAQSITARHPARTNGQIPPRPGLSARPHPQPYNGAIAWPHPSAACGPIVPAPPQTELILHGRVVLHGEGSSPGPVGRPPPAPSLQGNLTQHGAAGPHGTLVQQPSVGVRCRGPPPRYVPPSEQPGLRRSHSAGPQGLAVTARSMAPHPLTPETPALPSQQPAPLHPTASLPGNVQSGGGPYGPAPYGNETYGGTIQYDDNMLMAFTHHIPGPASSFREGLEADGWLVTDEVRAGADGDWEGSDDDEYGGGDMLEDFPRGPASPALHLFSSRPNTVPSELVSDLYGESRGVSRTLSHSHSFTLSPCPNTRRSSRLGLTLSRNGTVWPAAPVPISPERSSPLAVATTVASAVAAIAHSPQSSRVSPRLVPGPSSNVHDVARDSVLLASVRLDAVDNWMDSLRQRQQRTSRDGCASAGHSCSDVTPSVSPKAPPVEECLISASVSSSISGGAAAGAISAVAQLSAVNVSTAGEELAGTLGVARGEPAVAVSASFEDTLTAFMVEQNTATNPSLPKADRSSIEFNMYSNPVFNRPYTLDMSFQ
ncbi:hypothetical protein VaNZ11_010403 [Volvox africanus]|uniref:Uncharacterized protein n=1 Tax=Volvox africanus TaxID=51714 RepID=A0ABQ5S9C1_9CHLO|nr:hypothetical protein VaNZ11_010403 [Volvox africanus]